MTRIANLASRLAVAGVSGLMVLAGCQSSVSTPNRGSLTVLLTDKPFPYDSVSAVNVFVVRVDAKEATTDSADVDSNLDAATNGWVTIAQPNQIFNLLAYSGGNTITLGESGLTAGTYRSFRFVIDPTQSSMTLKDGTTLTGTSNPGIKFPSGSRSGLKVSLVQPVTVTSGGATLVVDFDVGASFVAKGSGARSGFNFLPVLRGVVLGETGGISGTIRANGSVLANATVEVLVNGTALNDTTSANVISTTHSDTSGVYTAAYLMPGTYSVRASPPPGSTLSPAILSGVTVSPNHVTPNVDLTLPSPIVVLTRQR